VPSDDWKERVARQQACERAAARRGYSREQWVRESGQ
jgi:sulfur relay (sulfurtransferase) complex TusBCD TusD component (DsrE family)